MAIPRGSSTNAMDFLRLSAVVEWDAVLLVVGENLPRKGAAPAGGLVASLGGLGDLEAY